MENLLIIKNFKCFYDIEIPVRGLTILAGANGNGKSTVIQALLFLRRTIEHCAKWENNVYEYKIINNLNVELNGAYSLALGNSNHILPRNFRTDIISLGVQKNNSLFKVDYKTKENQLWLTPLSVKNDEEIDLGLFKQEFYYLNAERLGPRVRQEIRFFDFPNAGYQGEFTAQLIADTNSNYQFKVDEGRKNIKSKSPRLEQQVNAWLDYIIPGVSITTMYDPDTHSAQIRVDNYFTKGDPTLSTNIGFGISYVLPIIVTGLIAAKNSIMIVENPEAHLHPSAQSKIGRFLSKIANSGVKVIVETHSDHFLNGVQIATATEEINNENVAINYFSIDVNNEQPDIETISINKKGELSKWPSGFFDQSQTDFAELFRLRKNG
jgi:predicted ATPase